jgi:flagellar protein FlaG
VIVTILLIVAGVVCSMAIVNAVYPAITSSSSALIDVSTKVNDRLKSQIEIIEVSSSGSEVYIWIKNVGASYINGIDRSDVFFGPVGNMARIPYGGSAAPRWSYSIENDTKWVPTATTKITLHLQSPPSGTSIVKVAIPNGISDEELFSS